MRQGISSPPVPDLARARGETIAELIDWFTDFYNTQGAPFNYRSATKAVRAAYKGIDKLHLLTAACSQERTTVGRIANTDVVCHAAPFAFNRATQVFDLSPRRFGFGRKRSAAYRIPFLFVEGRTIYAYFLQPRKYGGLNFDELCMVATIIKKYLLDVEFFGQRCDLEFIDVGVPEGALARIPVRYSLETLPLWSELRLTERLTMIGEALDSLEKSDRILRRQRFRARPEPEMPLFD